jgi:homoserine kinase type II
MSRTLADYDIGKILEVKPFKQGNVQTNIMIRTSKCNYVFRYYENRNVNRVKFEVRLLRYLHSKDYPVASPIKTINEEYVGIYKKKPFVLYDYVIGRHLKNISDNQLRLIVHKMALLHKLTKNYDVKNYVHDESRTIDQCLEIAIIEKKRFKDKKIGDKRFNILKSGLSDIKFPNTLTKGIIHGDFDKSNIKFHNNKISGILDFDDAHYGYKVHDLGILVMYWARFYSKKLDFEKAKKIVEYYEEVSRLSIIEKKTLV